jgi:uncharacterized protein YbjT (DUF2867 family)
MERVLVTGATGFVGRHLRVALQAAGYQLRLGARNPEAARDREPDQEWVAFDTDHPHTMETALEGCDAAFFLVHQVGARADYAVSETAAANDFARAAEQVGLKRLVYLGGVAPTTIRSRHLRSRRETGAILRTSAVPCIELRAAMIIGQGSASWRMVTDLAERLPAMVLPRWLTNHSWPIGIDDVVVALIAALSLQATDSSCYEIPGAERITHREMLLRVASRLGHRPVMVGVPVLSPRLSSYWIGLVTSVDLGLARELVQGLVTDLDPTGPSLWDVIDHHPAGLEETVALALADTAATTTPSSATRARMEQIGSAAAQGRGT